MTKIQERNPGQIIDLFAYPIMRTEPAKKEHEILTKHERLIRYLCQPFAGGVDIDDLLQEGRCALVLAARRYDPAFGAELWTYARKFVLGAILRVVARELSRASDVSYIETADEDGPASGAVADGPTPEDVVCAAELVSVAVRGLGERRRDVLVMHLRDDQDFRTIAAALGVKRTQLQEDYRRTIVLMRERAA